MTAQERADAIIDLGQRVPCGFQPDPNDRVVMRVGSLREAVMDAIEAAVQEERERCLALVQSATLPDPDIHIGGEG